MARHHGRNLSRKDADPSLPACRTWTRPPLRTFLTSLFLSLVISVNIFQGWSFILPTAHAAPNLATASPSQMTVKQFLQQGQPDHRYHGTFTYPTTPPETPPGVTVPQASTQLPAGAEPAKMHQLSVPLDSSLVAATVPGQTAPAAPATSATNHPLDLTSSDGRLEVTIPRRTFDLSHTRLDSGATPSGTLTLQIKQLFGHYIGTSNLLGSYQLQVVDAQGHLVHQAHVHQPVTITYHYTNAEMIGLNLNPDQMFLSWPTAITQAQANHASTQGMVVPLTNNATTQTLSASVTTVEATPFVVSGTPAVQSPAKSPMFSVQGNSGQLSYSYPLQVAPAPGGFAPQLALGYSSQTTNERQSMRSPAGDAGDGWSLELGSVSVANYPSTSTAPGTWYFLSGVGGVNDRLVPITGTSPQAYEPEHIARIKIQYANNCFHVWDKEGYYYELGCTADSQQYYTDSTGKHAYRYDVNKILAPYPSVSQVKTMFISYLQDTATTSGYTSVRDAGIKQIVYGYATATTASALALTAGTVDFQYDAPFNQSPWATAYTSDSNYHCSVSTSLRCDDPRVYNSVQPPTVMSTLELKQVTSYVGTDSASTNAAFQYQFSYQDSANTATCQDPLSAVTEYCAGNHLLTSITPVTFLKGTAYPHKAVALTYTGPLTNTYYDPNDTVNGAAYAPKTTWMYLSSYIDLATGAGASVSYGTAYNNSQGTPYITDSSGNVVDDRLDPLYCWNQRNNSDTTKRCSGTYAHPDYHAWSAQVVTQEQDQGSDTSALAPSTMTYRYQLAITGSNGCNPITGSGVPTQESDCVGDTWIPGYNGTTTVSPDGDWQDYFHGEYRGFNVVYTLPESGNVTADYYYSTEGWNSPESDNGNYNSGGLYKEDVYWGNAATDSNLLRETVNTYTGGSTSHDSCDGKLNPTYNPCEMMVLSTRTTDYEVSGRSSQAPWSQTDYTYDDYSAANGLFAGYHDLLQSVTTSSNAPTKTEKWQYYVTDGTTNGVFTYHDSVKHSEIDDSNSTVWKCQDTAYDEGQASGNPPLTAGWPTTVTDYSDCSNQSTTALKHYNGYDVYGNAVAIVDAFGAAHSSVYGSAGCTLSQAPAYFSASWSQSHYTSCTTYDSSSEALPITKTNALNQTTTTSYDSTQGDVPVSATDDNQQTTTTSYSIDSSGNRTVNQSQPGEPGSDTTSSTTNSQCTTSSTLPCFETDSVSSQYPGAVTRTFYDSMGRAVETRTPLDASHDLVSFTIYNDAANSTFQSVPFRVASGSGWIDPNGATDDAGVIPGGTATYRDPLGRTVATQDPNLGSASEPGIACNGMSGTYTTCHTYTFGYAYGDNNVYVYDLATDANNHVTVTYSDSLGRVRQVEWYRPPDLPGATPQVTQHTEYDVLDQPISVVKTDLAPQSGQTITSVTTTATYDAQGRLLTLNDPDKGPRTYTYDEDGHVLTDVSGARTIGTSYDLLGRIGCVQDAAPTDDGSGACSSGSHPLEQNTYDQSTLGSTDFPVGALTRSIGTSYYPDGSAVTTTQQFQHDQRGRLVSSTLQIGLPSSWNVSTALPTYQENLSYNDANQLTTTQTTVGGQSGYTFTQAYDSTTGELTGLSNNSVGAANLATLGYDTRGQVNAINFQTTTGTALANEQLTYDNNLRPLSVLASWQSGSGSSGNIFSNTRTYDAVGNVTSVTTAQAAIPTISNSGGSDTEVFCYDEENRLVWAGNSGTVPSAGVGTCGTAMPSNSLGGASYSASYAYTHLGQLWQGPLNGVQTQQQYLYCDSGHPHQLTGLYPLGTNCGTLSNATYSSAYDVWGNVTTRDYNTNPATLAYDALDRLVEWQSSGLDEWYAYTSSGARTVRRSATTGGTTITVYAFGSEEHVYDGSGNHQSDTYYYSLGGRLIGERTSSGTQFFLTDALGSVLSTFNDAAGSATILGSQTYSPYGTQLYSAGAMGTTKGFTGQYQDATGLDYFNARYYDPVAGRFLSADNVQGNLQGMDPYDYVGGNPETNADPSGQMYILPGDGGGDGGYTGGGGSSDSGGGWSWAGACNRVVCYGGGGSEYTQQNGSWQLYNPPTYYPPSRPAPPSPPRSSGASSRPSSGVHPRPAPRPAPHPGLFSSILNIGWGVVDNFFGFSSMWGDIQTLMGNGSWQDKAKALLDLGFNIFMDASMFTGVGEEARVAELAVKEGADLGEHLLEDSAEHAAEACGLSFSATTLVASASGEVAISSLHVGDQVWAYNSSTHKMELEPVQHVWINHDNDLLDLTIQPQTKVPEAAQKDAKPETIHTTRKHPFLTVERGFLPANALKPGMHVIEANGHIGVITKWVVVAGQATMYNLTVAHDHTYAVGVGQWVVHNCGITGKPDPANEVAGQSGLYHGEQVDVDALRARGWKMTRDVPGYAHQNGAFANFAQGRGDNMMDWEYRMQTLKKGNASVENHYWYNSKTGEYFHHH